jgi:hypothetical protein
MKERAYQVGANVVGINVDPRIGGDAAGRQDADLWPRWRDGVKVEPTR